MSSNIDNVSCIHTEDLKKPTWFSAYNVQYVQNGTVKYRDIISYLDVVTITIFNKTRNVLIFVKQFRPAVYFSRIEGNDKVVGKQIDTQKFPPLIGVTLELCAGVVDKHKCLIEIAKEEILEECGYDVPLDCLELMGSLRAGTGMNSNVQTNFYCEVSDEMKVHEGGGIQEECIEIVEMTIEEAKNYAKQSYVNSPPGFLYSIYWFLINKIGCACS